MLGSEPNPVSLSANDRRLRVEFTWYVDRFIHRLLLDEREVAKSVDGTADQSWPPSPPIQQLSFEQLDVGDVVLGVGAAGRSHWSISVQSCPDYPAALIFDLACKSTDSPEFLGNRYQFDPAVVFDAVNGERKPDSNQVSLCPKSLDKPTSQWSYRVRAK